MNNTIGSTMRQGQNIVGKFYPIQEKEIREMNAQGMLTVRGYIHLILKYLNPFLDKPLKIQVPEFLKVWKIARSSFYKAISELEDIGVLKRNSEEITIAFLNSGQQSQTVDSSLESETAVSNPGQQSQILEENIYIDRARAKTSKTKVDSKTLDTSEKEIIEGEILELDQVDKNLKTKVEVPMAGDQQNNSSTLVKTSPDCNTSVSLDLTDEQQDRLKKIHHLAFRLQDSPWRLNAQDYIPGLLDAVFRSNPRDFSLGKDGRTINRNFIRRVLKKLEQSLKSTNPTIALEAFDHLLDYAIAANPEIKAWVEQQQEVSQVQQIAELLGGDW